MSKSPDPEQSEHAGEHTPRPDPRSSIRRTANWFGAVFGVVVLVGAGVIYVTNRSAPAADPADPAAQEEEVAAGEEDEEDPEEGPVSEVSAAATSDASAVLLGMYVVDSFGFHGLEEAYAEADEVGERDAGQVAKVLTAVDAVAWPDELGEVFAAFRADVDGLHAALEAGDLEGARHGLEAVHGSQHDLSNGVYEWLRAAEPDGSTSAVLLGMYVVDSFGFHGLEEAYAEADEVGERDAGQVAKVLTAVDAVAWPDELGEVFAAFRADVDGLHAALEAGDLQGARHGLEAVHGSQHDLSNGVYAWLAGTPVEAHGGEQAGEEVEVIDVEMVDFGYVPDSIELQAGVPVVLRFTNNGRLVHEAMVGDAHMQEEFAAAGDHGDGQDSAGHDDSDDHHGGLMAVTVQPGETADLEVVIDEAGEWFVACHLVGHYEQGQIASIDVSA